MNWFLYAAPQNNNNETTIILVRYFLFNRILTVVGGFDIFDTDYYGY